MSTLARFFCVLVIAVSPWLTGCGTIPSTGQSGFIMLSREQEISLGHQARDEFLAGYGGPVRSPTIEAYINEVGFKLVEATRLDPEPWEVPWEFHVVDSAVVNAFAIPGGQIFITRGLLGRLENEAQLAAILAHECGHVTSRHSAQMISRQQVIGVIAAIIGTIGEINDDDALRALGVGAQLGGTVFSLRFSRENEYEADMLAIRYMTRAGYDPNALIEVFHILKSLGGNGGIEWLSTHPLTDNRIRRAQQIIGAEHAHVPSDRWVVGFDAFRSRALRPLSALPPPRHR